ncbi:hypothetical protein [Bradyrhizobium sp. UFLA05-112]
MAAKGVVFLSMLCFVHLSCAKGFTPPPVDFGYPATAPAAAETVVYPVARVSPAKGATVSETTNALEFSGAAGVPFLVDGTTLDADNLNGPHDASHETANLADATHTLSAQSGTAAKTSAANISIEANNTQGTPTRIATTSFCLSEAAVKYALGAEKVWYDPSLSGGAHQHVFNNAEVMKAINSYCGDTRTDAALLQQIRYVLAPNRGPTATGGYQDQKQMGGAMMFLLAKNTPRIWNQLTATEKALISINMEALTYSSVLTTKDEVHANIVDDMAGDPNDRDYNPNIQNGMIGMIIMTTLYWGADQFEAKLAAYDDAVFIAKLRQYGMTNLLWTYTNPHRPSGAVIQAGLRQIVNGHIYSFHGITERNLLQLFGYIADRTFSKTVACGLNGGAGIGGAARIVRNCDLLPNSGAQGMLFEFDSVDAEGQRSSAGYSWDSWYSLLNARAAMQMFGGLNSSSLQTIVTITASDGEKRMDDIINRFLIGTKDMLFKLSPAANQGGGYISYSHAESEGVMVFDPHTVRSRGYIGDAAILNVLQTNLGKPTVP